MKLKHTLLIIATVAATPMAAQQIADGQVNVTESSVTKSGNNVNVAMKLDMANLDIDSNEGMVLTPMLVGRQGDTLRMPAVEIMGRKRYIYYQRNNKAATDNPATVIRRNNGEAQTVDYSYSADYEKWMNRSKLVMAEGLCECQQTLIGDYANQPLADVNLFQPWNLQYAYLQPQAEDIKARQEGGSARLNFAVNKYDIRTDLANNANELSKIRQTIDLVRNDKDVELTGIALHGYASPDGKYSLNDKLAANRTEALRAYLIKYYSKLDTRLFTTSSTAEDWDSVRKYIAQSDLAQREALLKIIDNSSLTPDEKDRKIATTYGDVYRMMLQTIYPSVRRTDYSVTYNVRQFNLEEARRIIRERPQKLSQNEMYLVANSYEKGSADFCEVFDVAVRMYPSDPLANLNAANAALSRNDTTTAARYLAKAGNSAEAANARGILAIQQQQYANARAYFEAAAKAGLAEAKVNLQEMESQGE